MLSLGGHALLMFVDFVFLGVGVVCGFTSWVGCKSRVLLWGVIRDFICVSITCV